MSTKATNCQPDSKVQKWLESIPESASDSCLALVDVDLNLDAESASDNIKFYGCKGYPANDGTDKCVYIDDHNKVHACTMYLQGCPCSINLGRSKTDIAASKKDNKDKPVRRVTFVEDLTGGGDGTTADANKPVNVTAVSALDDDKFALRRSMQQYLQEIAKKRTEKLGKREVKYVPDERDSSPCIDGGDKDNFADETNAGRVPDQSRRLYVEARSGEADQGAGSFDDIVCVGHSERSANTWMHLKKPVPYRTDSNEDPYHRVRLPPWGSKALHLPRRVQINRRVMEKPLIKGLVVDSASNQQPSIVRASKNANIREQHALKTKIDGYMNECCQNINSIKLAQRKLTTNLAHLKNKMAATNAARLEEARARAAYEQSEMAEPFVPKAYPLVFPPLAYRNRRVLTVA